jgi:formylglycine-generating enzyme required for sulfatase activity
MILVEPGTFMMGSPESEPGRFADETQHQVTLSKPYYLAATEMTAEQYAEVMSEFHERKYGLTLARDRKPAKASWFDAVKYMEVLSNRSGYKFRMPTEAEWEYACRAGTTTPNFTGKSITREHANFDTREPDLELGTHEVA